MARKTNLGNKTFKLLRALTFMGYPYLLNKDQVWSEKLAKPCTLYKLYKVMSAKDYKALHPEKRMKKDKQTVNVPILESFRVLDILLALVDAYKALTVKAEGKEG